MKKISSLLFLLSTTLMISCGGETLPKPKGMLRLAYPVPEYASVALDCPYSFDKNEIAQLKKAIRNRKCWYNLEYPKLKATIYLSYFEVNNNLDSLLRDAQNLTQEHVVKADGITQEPYVNLEKKVYGMFYEVTGDAASQSQFYVTDSSHHFLSGSLYFKVKPNYDSILPAAHYLREDVKRLMETIEWK
ncbi:gliding motility lipoprotein GldD [Aquimarina sp. 2201CG5-10]|uniref:gliding motility lipoprotein GldD n=1 Tax=Aquimarina callyspongiae TaxID=3098150 RepID=UPI002AB3773A|nr:gliding motility lipoprotein GldD [Aquimarina sp. 2201CG5-10]MDY8135052.1 gliding motility lipoprotein GldD [Aquimarina sp. 2201CG5-10]